MKQLLFAFALLLSATSFAQTKSPLWTKQERGILLDGLRSSQNSLLDEVKSISNGQFHFKPDSATWSIAEITEHLAIYDELLYWDLLNKQYSPEMPEWVGKVKGLDSVMTAYTEDPMKLKAPFIAQPLGRFPNGKDVVAYFNRYRNEMIKLISETDTDFRLHFVFRSKDAGVWRVRDLHQYTLLWIAHTQRHTNQIKRVKAHQNYPK
ncbi:DinB family protein [Dyadobacter sp. CY261]|uniref:DinB family protein n=1 Tax=Dyadobacter sp. CY261 TaxID=2907203 RepID=UPI001F3ADD80|nr:DinB family protein [Dyadobacter sp. CY261]MCF0071342.1 DinB family protein [Dyadobacter sp. CY261]